MKKLLIILLCFVPFLLQAQQINFCWDTYENQSKDSMWLAIGGAVIDGIFG